MTVGAAASIPIALKLTCAADMEDGDSFPGSNKQDLKRKVQYARGSDPDFLADTRPYKKVSFGRSRPLPVATLIQCSALSTLATSDTSCSVTPHDSTRTETLSSPTTNTKTRTTWRRLKRTRTPTYALNVGSRHNRVRNSKD
jgi:hypothetical protein